jgi:uncharacterized protein YijF (DUF1287 family)
LTWLQTNDREQLQTRLLNLERFDGATYISLTRTATLSITTAGVIVTWQNAIENVGEWSWTGSSITVPIAGYYLISGIGTLGVKDNITGDVIVNGVEVATMGTASSKDTKFRHELLRFYKAGDVVQYRLQTATGTMTLQVNTEDSASESPLFHMVLL